MAERHRRHSKSSHRSSNREIAKRETRNYSKHNEPRTPPLPTIEDCSIKELLKKRDSLRQDLEKMKHFNKKSDKILKTNERKRKYEEQDKSKIKRINRNKKYTTTKNSSPDYNLQNFKSESEDEEFIIEQRRKQRKQLLEQLNSTQENTVNKEENNIISINTDFEKKNNTMEHSRQTTVENMTDMFSEKDDFTKNNEPENITQDNNEKSSALTDNWDDHEGYYNIRVGDCINNDRYTIKSILGQGVFANVVRAQDNDNKGNYVAIKIIRNNELMHKIGLKEIAILREINESDPENKYHCVKLLQHFVHKGHLCLVLESFYMDMRCVLKKYGKNNGFNLKALMNYSRQLLLALKLLKKIGIIHADIKPDNILVNEKKNILKLCDFGSAAKINNNEPTPYLVSRFYRAPEIILGIPYNYGVDIWSTACTIYEMATGEILFTGGSNNKMLKCFMDLKGKFPSKLLRKGIFKDQHFNYNNNFLFRKKDKFSEREKVTEICALYASRDLYHDLRSFFNKLSPAEEKKLMHLKDFLDKMLILDANQRMSVSDGLNHPFIQNEI